MMKVKVKKLHADSVIPVYAKHGDAGLDLTAVSKEYDDHGNVVYGTGLAIEIPHGYVGLLFPRSSNSKKSLMLSNSVGVIDSGYRGEILFKFKPSQRYGDSFEVFDSDLLDSFVDAQHEVGDRIGQIVIMPYPKIELVESDELSDSDRGVGGFGSTDPVTAAIENNLTP